VLKSRSILILTIVLTIACQNPFADKPAARITNESAEPSPTITDVSTAAVDTVIETAPESVTPVVQEKSQISFIGAKVTGQHVGVFHNFDGRIEYRDGIPDRLAFEIDLASVKTDQAKLDRHLQSEDFFDVAKYPKATFVSTGIVPAPVVREGEAVHTVRGVLDLHGQKKTIEFPVKVRVTQDALSATSEFTINRHDWGVSYKGAPDDLIRDDVLIKLNLHFPPPPKQG